MLLVYHHQKLVVVNAHLVVINIKKVAINGYKIVITKTNIKKYITIRDYLQRQYQGH